MKPRRYTLKRLLAILKEEQGEEGLQLFLISHISRFPFKATLFLEGIKASLIREGWEFPIVWKYPNDIEAVARLLQELGAAPWDEETFQRTHPSGELPLPVDPYFGD